MNKQIGMHEVIEHARASAQDASVLGSLFWWELSSNHIAHHELEAIGREESLDSDYLPNEIKPSTAFRRAIRSASNRLPDGYELKAIADDDETVFGLIRIARDAQARDLEFTTCAKVRFEKKTLMVYVDETELTPAGFADSIRALVLWHSAHNTEDVRGIATAFLAHSGVAIRGNGGVYFVPERYRATLNSVQRTIERAGGNRTYSLPIVDSAQARATMASVAESGLGEEIRQIEAELSRFDFSKARDSTLANKLESFNDLRARVGLFASLLSMRSQSLSERLDHMTAVVRHYASGGAPENAPKLATEEPAKEESAPIFDPSVGF